MKATLIKEAGGYDLYRIDEDNKRVTFASTQDYKQKLSLKNCQAIESGYDLENMSDLFGAKVKGSVDFKLGASHGFEAGFQKALEILGDKKFSEIDMERMSLATSEWENSEIEYGKDILINKVFQLLQQTKWDVTFNPEELDADGCLILKTFKSE